MQPKVKKELTPITFKCVDLLLGMTLDDPGYKKIQRIIRDFVADASSAPQFTNEEAALNQGGHAQPFPPPYKNPQVDTVRREIELNKLDRNLRQKLEIDKPYNMLRIIDGADGLIIDIPVFRGPMLDASAEEILRPLNISRVFGSCAFELASLLQLLPGQPLAGLMETKTYSFQQLVYDTDTYYAKCSRDGLLRLITQHFSSIKESSGHLVIKTSIGTFTLTQTDRLLVVKVNCSERAASAIAPQNQDYSSLKKCAAGLWCTREEGHTDETHQDVLQAAAQGWTRFPKCRRLTLHPKYRP